MQSYKIKVKAFKVDITQYKNHIQGTEKTWSEYLEM